MSSSEWKESEFGRIPIDWEICELKEKSNIIMGQSPKSESYNKKHRGVPFLQGRTTFGDKYHEIDTWCTEPKRYADKGEVLMSVRAPVGDVNISTMKLCIGRGLASLSMKNGNNEYLYYLLKNYVEVINSKSSGTVFSSINKNDIEALKLPFANDIEQKAISNILSSLDEKIELNNQMNKTLEEMAQALFKRWFVDFEFPNEEGEPYKSSGGEMVDSELGMIPKGWKVETLDSVCNLSAGGDKPKKYSDVKTEECGVPIYSNGIDNEGLYGFTDKAKVFEKSVTVSARGTIGFICLRLEPYIPIVRLISVIPKDDRISSEFIYHWLKTINIQSTGTTQQQITVPAFKKEKILVPDIEIMKIFTSKIEVIVDRMKENKMENKILSSIRDTLLPKLMSGEIRVKDLQN